MVAFACVIILKACIRLKRMKPSSLAGTPKACPVRSCHTGSRSLACPGSASNWSRYALMFVPSVSTGSLGSRGLGNPFRCSARSQHASEELLNVVAFGEFCCSPYLTWFSHQLPGQ